MTRPVQPIGTFGTIAVKKVRERTFYASTRFRAYNGGYIRFSATGASERAAQRELKSKLADYTEAQKADGSNSLSPLSDVAAIWLHEVSTAGRLSPQTIDAYADNLRAVLCGVADRGRAGRRHGGRGAGGGLRQHRDLTG